MIDITYGRLDRALRGLGFTRRLTASEPKNWVYEHASGAELPLPVLPEEDPVLPRHLAAVQGTLKHHGIATPDDLAERLREAG